MPESKFKSALEKFLDGSPPRRVRIRWWLWAAYYKYFWRWNLRWRPIIRNILVAGIPAAAPILAWWFAPQSSPDLSASLWWAAAIFGLTVIVNIGNKLLSGSASDPTSAEEMLMRVGEAIMHTGEINVRVGDRESARRACLSIIEVYIRAVTGARVGEIGVALARYNGRSTQELRIDDRDKGNRRRTGQTFNGRFNLGHHACVAGGDPRAVYDLKEFGPHACKSPTGSKGGYRSVFIVPIMKDDEGKLRPVGYVSIDSVRPYEFYGNRANVIAVDLGNIVGYLKKLI